MTFFPLMTQSPLAKPFMELSHFLADSGTKILVTIVIIMVGWMAARLGRVFLIRGLRIIRLDVLAEKAGIEGLLRRGGVQNDATQLLGALLYWAIIIFTIITMLKLWDLEVGISAQLLPLLPKLLISIVILILGLYLASFVGDLAASAASGAGVSSSIVLGSIIRWVIVIFVTLTALQQLGIAAGFITQAFLIILAGLSLALGLALGLGARPVVEEILKEKLKTSTKTNRNKNDFTSGGDDSL